MTNDEIIVKATKKYCIEFIKVIDNYIQMDIANSYDLGKRKALSDILEYIEIIERGEDND